MSSIRIVIQSSPDGLDDQIPTIIANARDTRNEPGCMQFEQFRGIEFPEHLLLLELWESEEIYDKHWHLRRQTQAAAPPGPPRKPPLPRRHGQNGLEFYHAQPMTLLYDKWVPVEGSKQMQTIRWPVTGKIRVTGNFSPADPEAAIPAMVAEAVASREEPGCLQFEYLRSLEFPNQIALVELWESPAAFDTHWKLRVEQMKANPRPPAQFAPRQHGVNGLEINQHAYYAQVDGVWTPADPAVRTETVYWP